MGHTNTNTNANNLFPPIPMRYNKIHNVNTILNNKAQLRVFLSSFVKFHFGFSLWIVISSLLRIFHEVVVEDFLSSSNDWELVG